MTSDETWATDMINIALKLGATLVTDEQYQKRVEVCDSCEYQDEIKLPVPGSKAVKGCMLCGCPRATKPKYKRYFSFQKLRMIDANCPEGLWREVDSNFLTKISKDASST